MSYTIQDRIEISVAIGDLNYPIGELNTLNYLHMGSSIRLLVPTLKFSITDQAGILNESILNDAENIRVTVKSLGDQTSRTYVFVCSGFSYSNAPLGVQYEIFGYGFPPIYFAGTTTEGIRGTSNYVLQKIAQKCGLRYDGTETADAQLWMPQNRTYSVFAKRTANAGFVNNQSLMKLGLCMDGTLRYKNINDIPDVTARLLQGKTDQGFIPIVNHKPKADNGSNNVFTGYALERRKQDADLPEKFDQLTFTPNTGKLLMDTKMKSKIDRGLQAFSPLNFGNTNEAYDRGIYQNRRYSSLYSFGCDFQTIYVSGLRLLDKIDFTSELDNGTVNNSTTGEYIVTSHAVLVQGTNYYEKIEGFRQGTNWR